LFGARDAVSPATAPGEAFWFVTYGLASFAYRMFIMFVIVVFIAGKFFIIGGLLAVWAVSTQIALPMAKTTSFVLTSPKLRRRRTRAVLTSGGLLGLLMAVLFLLPAPLWTRAEGVVWMPEQSQVRAAADAAVVRLLARDETAVQLGTPLVETEDPLLSTRVELLEAQFRELEARLASAQFSDRAKRDVIRQEMAVVAADLTRARERLDALVIRSPADGVFVVPRVQDLPGRYVRRGEVIGYVIDSFAATIRVVVGQDDIGLVRESTQSVAALLADWDAVPIPARILREVPAASNRLPTAVLGTAGGGAFAVNPRDTARVETLEKVFQFDVSVPERAMGAYMGRRVHIRFDHGEEPLGFQWFRLARQLFLSRFGV
jgi:putative peptide zinc metalloprotease protein